MSLIQLSFFPTPLFVRPVTIIYLVYIIGRWSSVTCLLLFSLFHRYSRNVFVYYCDNQLLVIQSVPLGANTNRPLLFACVGCILKYVKNVVSTLNMTSSS